MNAKNALSIVPPLRDRILVVSLVVLVHVWLLWAWKIEPASLRLVDHQMAISIESAGSQQDTVSLPAAGLQSSVKRNQPAEAPQSQSEPRLAATAESSQPASPAAADSLPVQAANTLPVLADREPDYQAAYLRNPAPDYPLVARRMGWQGRVVLNVEVLANGLPGQIKLQQSSGHEVLDNAALQALRSWRFEPAHQGGQAVTEWFLVPIPFILKEAE